MFTIYSDVMAQLMKRVGYCASSDVKRLQINSVLFEQDKKVCTIVSTDGHRMAKLRFDASLNGASSLVSESEAFKTNIPAFLLQKSVYAPTPTRSTTIIISRDAIKTEAFDIKLREPQKFPPYDQVIPKHSKFKVTIDRKELLKALRALKKGVGKGYQPSNGIFLIFEDSPPSLSLICDMLGEECSQAIGMEATGKDAIEHLRIGVNPAYLQEVCTASNAGKLELSVSGSMGPLLISSEETVKLDEYSRSTFTADYTCIIMPIRI